MSTTDASRPKINFAEVEVEQNSVRDVTKEDEPKVKSLNEQHCKDDHVQREDLEVVSESDAERRLPVLLPKRGQGRRCVWPA